MKKPVTILGAGLLLAASTYAFVEYLNIRPSVRVSQPITYNESIQTTGYRTVHAVSSIGDILLTKPGGFITNDILPPFVLMDDMPEFEYGAIQVLRKTLVVMRDNITRNQTQSLENPHVVTAFNKMNIDTESWIFPSAESEYREGIKALEEYKAKIISDVDDGDTDNFYTRATALAKLMETLNSVMGNHAQALGNAVSDVHVNIELAGEKNGESAKNTPVQIRSGTKFTDIDNAFWQANGSAWAILEILKAVRVDFKSILQDKNALPVIDQIISQLEASQQSLDWFWVANGSGFGVFANHSLVLRSYIANASQSMSDLIRLLEKG